MEYPPLNLVGDGAIAIGDGYNHMQVSIRDVAEMQDFLAQKDSPNLHHMPSQIRSVAYADKILI